MKKLIRNILLAILDYRSGWGDKPIRDFDVWLYKMIVKLGGF